MPPEAGPDWVEAEVIEVCRPDRPDHPLLRPHVVVLRERNGTRRFTSFRTIYVPAVGQLAESRFELLPTGQRPHFTVRLRDADAPELDRLLKALGAAQPNPQYARGMIWREEG